MSTDYENNEEVMEDEDEFEVDYIYKHRGCLERNNIEYFVHWKGYPDSDNSWVSSDRMACAELIGEYFDRREAKKAKKNKIQGAARQMGSRASSSAPSAQNEPARNSSVPPVLQRDTARGTSSAQKERVRDKSTTPAVSKEPMRRSSATPSKQKEPNTVDAAQKVPPIRLQLPSTSKESLPSVEPEHPPLKLKISRSSVSTEMKEPTVLAEESPTRRKKAQRSEVDDVEPQISQLRISEDSEPSSLGSSESVAIQKKTIKYPKVPPLPKQKQTSMVEKRSPADAQEKSAATSSRHTAPLSSSGTAMEKKKTPKEMTSMPDSGQTLQKEASGQSSAEEIPGSSNQILKEPGATPSPREETPAPISQEIKKTTIADVMPDMEMTPAPEVGPPQDEERMDTDEPLEGPIEPTPEADTTSAEVVEEPGSSKDSEQDEAAEASAEQEEEAISEDDDVYSNSDISESEAEEQNDDDISDLEDFQQQKDQKTPVREDKMKNGYEKGMKSETLISFVKKGDVISGLVKFEGSNQLDIIPYAKLRLLDPALVASYHVKMLLHRSTSDNPPAEGLIEGLETTEVDSSF